MSVGLYLRLNVNIFFVLLHCIKYFYALSLSILTLILQFIQPARPASTNVTFYLLTVAVETSYLRIYRTDLHQIFTISTHMDGHDQSDLLFANVQGTLL